MKPYFDPDVFLCASGFSYFLAVKSKDSSFVNFKNMGMFLVGDGRSLLFLMTRKNRMTVYTTNQMVQGNQIFERGGGFLSKDVIKRMRHRDNSRTDEVSFLFRHLLVIAQKEGLGTSRFQLFSVVLCAICHVCY